MITHNGEEAPALQLRLAVPVCAPMSVSPNYWVNGLLTTVTACAALQRDSNGVSGVFATNSALFAALVLQLPPPDGQPPPDIARPGACWRK